MLTLKAPLSLFAAVALLLVGFAANAAARGGSHGSGMHSLGRPAGASATTPMPGGSAALPAAVAGGNARANALLTAPAAAVEGGVTALTPGAALASPATTAGSSGGANPAATTAATAASAGAVAAPAVSAATPAVAGPPAPATPEPALPALSPMSDPLQTQFATGGGSSPNLALSPSSSSSSPSESAPSSPGGGGKSLQDCMGFWDAATHMTKPEWRAACKRSMAEFPDVKW